MSRGNRHSAILFVFLTMIAVPVVAPSASVAATSGNYIVVLKDSVRDPGTVANEHRQRYRESVNNVYRYALKGYAASISIDQVSRVRADPEVQSVSEDAVVHASKADQAIPNAVRRIAGDKSSTRSGDGRGMVNINVAVLDTGIDATHPDLNVVGGTNCLNGKTGRTLIHGTLVAGVIGAIDNKTGVVGVAPGARVWAVEVIHENSGTDSEVICGIDWVTGTRTDSDPTNDISVANMSFGGSVNGSGGTGGCAEAKGAFQVAVCGAVAAGVTIVAAAGNAAIDLATTRPATYDDVLVATAMRDIDGQPGGLADPANGCETPYGPDDAPASFSNFANSPEDKAHSLAAPGVCISSTFPGGLYALASGTSFGAPLVSGTVALCIASGDCAGLTPAQIVHRIVSDSAAYSNLNPSYGFNGDPLHNPDPNKYYGYLIRAALY